MRENFRIIFKSLLALGDIFCYLLSFTLAYIFRVKLMDKPVAGTPNSMNFIISIALFIPIWIASLAALGLYSEKIYKNRVKEISRLILAAILNVLIIIAINYYNDEPFLPAKLITVYALLFIFLSLFIERICLHSLAQFLITKGYGRQNTILVGNNTLIEKTLRYMNDKKSGYKIIAIVTSNVLPLKKYKNIQFKTLAEAVKNNPKAELVFQTDTKELNKNYQICIENHMNFKYIPAHESISNYNHTNELINDLPVIDVHATPLFGYGKVIKRIMDIILSIIGIVLSLPAWIPIMIIMKIAEPTAPIFFKQKRLTRGNKEFYLYKFRSHKMAYSGLDPEEAFTKMGKPELIKKYRANGDQLDNDPRVTIVGNFIRKTSLDELPQLLNILKGDISLVGPRALIARELDQYSGKNLILSVKSGLTGLAQVSGRRDISFEERRALDVYYVQNWSIWLDIQILFKTVTHVLLKIGAK